MATQSTQKKTVTEALAAAAESIDAIGKNSQYEQGNTRYKYRSLEETINAVSPVFREAGIVMVPVAVEHEHRDVGKTSGGATMTGCTVQVTYRVYGPNGDYIDVMAPGEGRDSSDKATAKAMSVAWRTALGQMLCIPYAEDPDKERPEVQKPSQDEGRPVKQPKPSQDWADDGSDHPFDDDLPNDDELRSLLNGLGLTKGKIEAYVKDAQTSRERREACHNWINAQLDKQMEENSTEQTLANGGKS